MGNLEKLIESPYTALVFAVIVGGLALSGKFTVTATHFLLAIAWVIVVIGLHGQPTPVLVGSAAIAGGFLILLGFWFSPDPVPGYSGILYPKIDTILSSKQSERTVEIGNSGGKFIWKGPNGQPIFDFFETSNLMLESVNGKLLVSTQIRDEKGNLVAELVRNEWKVSPPPKTWDRNYNDNALEVKNEAGRVVLQTKLLSDRVQLQGEWLNQDGGGLRLVESEDDPPRGLFVVFGPRKKPSEPPFIKPIFHYPSATHFGELIQ
jgi:hypothetical protein